MKILVTGATGFVGACLTRRLVLQGKEVHIFTRHQSDKWRIADLSKDLINHEVDLCDFIGVEKAVDQIRPTIIYHLATYGGFAFQQDTRNIINANLLGTINLLQACEKTGFDCFVNTGSSSEYGLKTEPMKESDLTVPIGDYGVSKVAATLFCQSEARRKKLPVVTLRLFSPYGNWDDPKRFIPYVIKSFLRGQRPELSTPAAVRDYIFIEDVLDFYQGIVNRPKLKGDILNVGSGIQHTIGEVAATIARLTGSDLEPVWGAVGQKRPESSQWLADTCKSKQAGLKIRNDLTEGLSKTVEWVKENINLYP